MKDTARWHPTEAQIERLLIDTRTHRDALALVLRNQKVSVRRARQNMGYSHKTVTRIVHFVYFNPDTRIWTGQIHRDQTEWQIVQFDQPRKIWRKIES